MHRHIRSFLPLFASLLILACAPLAASTPAPTTAADAPTSTPDVDSPAVPKPTPGSASPAAPKPTPEDGPLSTPTPSPVEADIASVRQHLEVLCEDIGPRTAGSPEEEEAAEYIQDAFEEMDYEVEVQTFSFRSEYDHREEESTLTSANVIAVKPGLSSREIIVGAHYDSVDDGDGADDNASGVAVMLTVAEMVQDIQTPYTILFITFGCEEENLDGSHYYVDRMSASEIQNTVGMINLDSLIAGDFAYVYGDTGPGSLYDWILARAHDTGFDLEGRPAEDLDEWDGTPCDCADYDAFQEARIPFAYFEATNWDLGDRDGMTQVDTRYGEDGEIRHTEYDTLEYIDDTFPGRIDGHVRLFVTLLYDTLTQYELPQ